MEVSVLIPNPENRRPAARREARKALVRRMPRFVVLSLGLHFALMVALSRQWIGNSFSPEEQQRTVEIELLDIPTKVAPRTQVAETKLAEKSETPAADAYLGHQTQNVSSQTRASVTAPYRELKQGGGDSKEPGKTGLGSLGVKMDLRPMGSIGPGQLAASNDYLKDVAPGAQTLLNTREFAFFSFYQRVRTQLEQYWEPGLRRRLKVMFERGRRLASDHEHITRLVVVLNADGKITRVQVESTSGFLDLDQAAIEAFNRAGPFPNPPRGMLERDGTVKVEWEFVLKT